MTRHAPTDVLAQKGRWQMLYCSAECARHDGAEPLRSITQQDYEALREKDVIGACCPWCEQEYYCF